MTFTEPPAGRAVHRLLGASAALTFLAVLLGAVVCATESGFDCPSWPGCYPDRTVPVGDVNPWIEFAHRGVAVITGVVVFVAAIAVQRTASLPAWVKRLPWVTLIAAGAAAVFGMVVVLFDLPVALGVLDLACALVAMTASAVAAAAARCAQPRWKPDRVAAVAWVTVGAVVLLHLSGIVVAGPASLTRCLGWPSLAILDGDGQAPAQAARLALAAIAGALVVATAVLARRRGDALRRRGSAALTLLAGEVAVGLVISTSGLSPEVRYEAGAGMVLAALHAVVAVALLRVLVGIAARGSVSARPQRVVQECKHGPRAAISHPNCP